MFGKSLGKEKSKTHKTALCIVPPQSIWSPIQSIRKQHDRQFFRWMPHINLLYPFKPKSSFFLVMDLLVHACSRFEPFEITLSTIRCFQQGKKNYTLWLAPEPQATIRSFQNKLCGVVPECNDLGKFAAGFTPHLSLGQSTGHAKTQRLITSLQTSWKPIRFTIKEICLVWRKDPPNDRFRIGERIRLGKQPSVF